jgi:hypothetical protein
LYQQLLLEGFYQNPATNRKNWIISKEKRKTTNVTRTFDYPVEVIRPGARRQPFLNNTRRHEAGKYASGRGGAAA